MRWLYLSLLMVAFLLESYALWSQKSGDTISETVWALSHRPLVPFAIGFLMGHFFWQKECPPCP